MQGITRNYLASPSIMGVSDGSAFIITLCMVLLPQSSSIEMMIYSFIGSALGAVLVFGLAAMMPNGFTPVQLAIIGTVTSMLLSSLSAAMSIYFQISQDLSFWYSARLHQMSPDFPEACRSVFPDWHHNGHFSQQKGNRCIIRGRHF